jgi:membrane protein required for colicin V production
MNGFDLAIVGVILVSAIIGVFRGFVRETVSLVAWILAFGVAWTYASSLAPVFAGYVDSPSLQIVAGFAVLFLVTLVLASIIGMVIHRLVRKAGLTGPDRSLGFVFGLIRGGILVAVLVFLAGTTPLPQETWWKQSHLVGYFQALSIMLLQHMPPDIARQFGYS